MIATGGDVALIILASAWAVLVAGLIYVLMSTHAVLQSTKILIDTMREETVPLMEKDIAALKDHLGARGIALD